MGVMDLQRGETVKTEFSKNRLLNIELLKSKNSNPNFKNKY